MSPQNAPQNTVSEKIGIDRLEEVVNKSVEDQHLPKQRYQMNLVAERCCCGVWQRIATIAVEAVEDNRGNLMFLNPVKMPEGWQKFSLTCRR